MNDLIFAATVTFASYSVAKWLTCLRRVSMLRRGNKALRDGTQTLRRASHNMSVIAQEVQNTSEAIRINGNENGERLKALAKKI